MANYAKAYTAVRQYARRFVNQRINQKLDDRDFVLREGLQELEKRSVGAYPHINLYSATLAALGTSVALMGLTITGTNLIGSMTKSTGTSDLGVANKAIVWTAKVPGAQTITLTIQDTGALSIVSCVAGAILIHIDGVGNTSTTTATALVNAIAADPKAKFWLAGVANGTGLGVVTAQTVTINGGTGTKTTLSIGGVAVDGETAGFGITSYTDTVITFDFDATGLPSGVGYDLALRVDDVLCETLNLVANSDQQPDTSMATASATAKTLSVGGVLTTTQSYHTVDTFGAAASQDMVTISGLVDGQFAILRLANAAHNVVLKHGSDNIVCPYGQDITLDIEADTVFGQMQNTIFKVLDFEVAAVAGGGLGTLLESIANAKGASLIGVEDAGTATTAATVEAWLAELGAISKDSVDGNHNVRVAKVTIDPSLTAGERTIAVHATAVSLPDNARVIRAWYEVMTTFTSATDAATVSLSIPTDDVAGIKAAVAISDGTNPWDAGLHECIQDGTAAAFSEQTTAARAVSFEVAVEELTAGKLVLFLEYVVGV